MFTLKHKEEEISRHGRNLELFFIDVIPSNRNLVTTQHNQFNHILNVSFFFQNLPKGADNVGFLKLAYISKVSPHSNGDTFCIVSLFLLKTRKSFRNHVHFQNKNFNLFGQTTTRSYRNVKFCKQSVVIPNCF